MTLSVIISHYFGEVQHGITAVRVGWLGVSGFFVLSGFLIGNLILDKKDCGNFFSVFYVRRACRILPPYFLTVLLVFGLLFIIKAPWRDADLEFPLWVYLLFLQNFWMAATDSIGAHWLGPMWTLAVEEHFYLVAPALIVFLPRRWLAPVLFLVCLSALALKTAVFGFGMFTPNTGFALTPSVADMLGIGVLTSLAVRSGRFASAIWEKLLPFAPSALLFAVIVLGLSNQALSNIFRQTLASLAAGAYIVCIVRNQPIGQRMRSRVLRFFGDNGYCLYLTHLPVLGLMHGLLLGTRPDLATPVQWAVTIATLPLCVLVGWGMTRLVEEPFMRYGRTWRWAGSAPATADAAQNPPSGRALPDTL